MIQESEKLCGIEVHAGDPRESPERIGEVRTAIDWRTPMQQVFRNSSVQTKDGRVTSRARGALHAVF